MLYIYIYIKLITLLYEWELNEAQCQKTYLRIYVPREGSNQPVHSPSLVRIFSGHIWISKDANILHTDIEDSDQTAQMRSLIRVFVGCTYQKVRFLTLRLKFLSFVPVS